MKFNDYVKELGISEIIEDLKDYYPRANEEQKEAISTMIEVYGNALKGVDDIEPLQDVLKLTVADEFDSNEKLNNAIRKHALVSMLFLVELSKQGKGNIHEWVSSIVVSTTANIDGDTYESKTVFNVNNDNAPEVKEQQPETIEVVAIDNEIVDIPLQNRLKGVGWLEDNAPNNPMWSGYIGEKSLVDHLEKIETFDRELKIQELTNISDVRAKMKSLNILISKRFEFVINGYRGVVGIPLIKRGTTQTGADEVSFYADLVENDLVENIISIGNEVTINYFADSLFYKLVRQDSQMLERAKMFMLTIFITECKHIKDDKSDRYILTYHYDLSEENDL